MAFLPFDPCIPQGGFVVKSFLQRRALYKRGLAALFAAVLCLVPVLSLADAAYLTVKGGTLNLRESADLTAKVLGRYPTGTWVMVLEEGDPFDKVQVGAKTGFMMKSFLTGGNGAAIAARFVRTNTGTGVNLRASPADSGMVVTGVAEGTKVDVLLKGITWYKVRVDSQTGYIASVYLSSEAGGASQYAVVNNPKNSQYLNLRETASQSAAVLGKYKNFTPVSVLSGGDIWCKVQVDGKTGYMMKAYLKMTAAPFAATLGNPNGGSVVNFRSGPSFGASVISKLPVGTGVTVLDKGTDWTLVSVNSATGYVSTWFLVY
jgi:uncharacterized protein YgiM (DUF1202 family)